jgi:hypothetical protein
MLPNLCCRFLCGKSFGCTEQHGRHKEGRPHQPSEGSHFPLLAPDHQAYQF